MWIFSTIGMMSVVAVDANDTESDLLVRSRDRETIDAVVDGVELFLDDDAEDLIVNDPAWMHLATDYPFRVRVPREAFVQWLAHDTREFLTYTNFKNALGASRGEPYTTVAHEVWTSGLKLTEPGYEDFGAGYGRWVKR